MQMCVQFPSPPPNQKALYFGIVPIYRALFASSVCNIFILCKEFLIRNNAFLTLIAHIIAHKKLPSEE
jgi:hypothetical protein